MHAHAGNKRVQRDKFAELLRSSMMNYVDPESGQRSPLSQRYLARNVIDVNEQTISRWVRQETAPSPEMVERVADFFGWSDDDLEAVYGLAQGEERFEDWRTAVGLELGFPRLGPLMHPWPPRDVLGREQATRDSRRFHLSAKPAEADQLEPDQREVAEEAYQSLGLARVTIRTAPGHGATTLSRWIYDHAAQEAISRRMVPVLVSLEQLIDDSYEELAGAERRCLVEMHGHGALGRRHFDEDADRIEASMEIADERATAYFGHIGPGLCVEQIEGRIRFALVRSLATQPWELALPRSRLAELIGAASGQQEAIEIRRQELAVAFDRFSADEPGFWDGMSVIAPSLGREELSTILHELHSGAGARVALILDLSATPMGRRYLGSRHGEYLAEPYRRVLGHVNKALESIQRRLAGGPGGAAPAPLDTTLVLSAGASSLLSPEWQEHAIDFPATRPLDLFAILANHYPPESQQQAGGRVEVLAAVLDSEFIQLDERTAISTETVLLEEGLKRELSVAETIPYHLRKTASGRGRRSGAQRGAAAAPGDELTEKVRAAVRELAPEIVRAEVERQLSLGDATVRKETGG